MIGLSNWGQIWDPFLNWIRSSRWSGVTHAASGGPGKMQVQIIHTECSTAFFWNLQSLKSTVRVKICFHPQAWHQELEVVDRLTQRVPSEEYYLARLQRILQHYTLGSFHLSLPQKCVCSRPQYQCTWSRRHLSRPSSTGQMILISCRRALPIKT